MKAIITGASSGIGEAIAKTFAKIGIQLFLTGRNEEKLYHVTKLIRSYGTEVQFAAGDVAIVSDVDRIFEYAKTKIGQIDILVANAGVGYFNYLEKMSDREYNQMFDTNVRGVFNWVRKILPQMKERNKGQIIIVSSTGGLNSYAKGGLYCATKHAIQAMAGSLRLELTDTRIKVATINPGSVDTPWFNNRKNFKEERRKTMLKAQDVANAAKLIVEQAETSNIDKIILEY